MTDPVDGAEERFPFLRDLDGYFYARHHGGRLVVGAFEPKGKPKAPADVAERRLRRVRGGLGPLRAGRSRPRASACRCSTTSGSSTTSAHRRASRPTRTSTSASSPRSRAVRRGGDELAGHHLRPGVGKALAEWIVEGHPTMDLTEVDIARIGPLGEQPRVAPREDARERSAGSTRCTGRGCSPTTAAVFGGRRSCRSCDAAGAAIGEAAGWERAAWFEPALGQEPAWRLRLRPAVVVRARRGGDARDARGRRAVRPLDVREVHRRRDRRRCRPAASCARRTSTSRVGKVVYTLLCNERGGIEMDPTVTRLDEDRFLVLAPTLYQRRTEMLLRNGLPPGATVTDVTSGFATLHLAGPRSRDVLVAADRPGPLERGVPVPRRRARSTSGGRRRAALRVSFTGELGWELLGADGVRRRRLRQGGGGGRRPRAPARGRIRVRRAPARARVPLVGARHRRRSTIRTRPGSGSRCIWRRNISSVVRRWPSSEKRRASGGLSV